MDYRTAGSRMQLPHCVIIIAPLEIPDAYGNPTPQLEYGPRGATPNHLGPAPAQRLYRISHTGSRPGGNDLAVVHRLGNRRAGAGGLARAGVRGDRRFGGVVAALRSILATGRTGPFRPDVHREGHDAPLTLDVTKLLTPGEEAMVRLQLGDVEQACRHSDHVLDAVISAMLARAAALNLAATPPADQLATAQPRRLDRHPNCTLGQLTP
jgi:hypothetical protein